MTDLIRSIRERDPAKPGFFEVIFAYPGYHAVSMHGVSSFLWRYNFRTPARIWAHLARLVSGIEIHPAAKIGERLFIDHGMGVVIGETSEIGDDVTLYHGVTLGGRGGRDDEGKRHPTLESEVMIGAGAQVLGPVTIGRRARVGANAVVIRDVPPGCTVVGNPGRLVKCPQQKAAYGFPDETVPDPVGETITAMLEDIKDIKAKLNIVDEKPSQDSRRSDYIDLWKGSGI